MFAHLTLAFALTIAASSVGAAIVPRSGETCSSGPIQCCNSLQKVRLLFWRRASHCHSLCTKYAQASSPSVSNLLGLLGVVVQGADAFVGLNCSPIPILGLASGASCSSEPVCCENNSVVRLLSLLVRARRVDDVSVLGNSHQHWLCAHQPLSTLGIG